MRRTDYARTVQIDELHRLIDSVNGKPRYHVRFTDGTWAVTQSDASFAYAIGNPEFQGVDLRATFTPAGRIRNIAIATPDAP